MNFPLFNTKELSDGKKYDLNDPAERKLYFQAKLGPKIEELKEYLDNNTFVAFLLAKKSAGKGTYSKMFQEIVGSERVAHLSVGDVVRDISVEIKDPAKEKELVEYVKKNYRGFMSVEDVMNAFAGRTQDKLLPTEFILTLVKREIEKIGKKALFIDGLPRNMDQISYSLYFRELINFRDDPDFFVLIDVPESVIDERMKYRVVCPTCHTSRNTKLLPTKFVKYDKEKEEFYLMCDNPECPDFEKVKLVGKEGDEHGIELIRDRLDNDQKLLEIATSLYGIPKVMVRNCMSVEDAKIYAEEYELTPEFVYSVNDEGVVEISEKPWIIKDENGVDSHSLMAPPTAVSLTSQIYDILLGGK